jgi:hypothetical protein
MKLFIHPLAAAQIHGTAVGTACVQNRYTLLRGLRGENFDDVEVRHEILDIIEATIEGFEFPANGQGFLQIPDAAKELLLTGAISRPADLPVEALKVRKHRGEFIVVGRGQWFVDEGHDLTPTFAAAIVYTMAAYREDPQVTPAEVEEAGVQGATHVLINIIGSQAPTPPVSPRRFIRNLAGGNARYREDARVLDESDPYSATEMVRLLEEEAKEILAYDQEWLTLG